jgi:3-oxoadipate enol-lactonase
VPWAEVNGISLYYQLESHHVDDTVVLLHEMGGTLQSWDDIVPGLSRRYTVLRYDQRGSGLSEKVRAEFSPEVLVDDLEALVDELSLAPRLHFVAIAASAATVLMMADRNPAAVASQVLCNPVVEIATNRAAQLEERASLVEREGIRASLPVTLDRSYPANMGDPAAYLRYRGRYLANDPYCFANMNRALARTNVADLLSLVRCPTMVVAGQFDEVRPAKASEEVAGLIPGARFEVIESGHMMAAQSPAALLAVIEAFLTEVTDETHLRSSKDERREVAGNG